MKNYLVCAIFLFLICPISSAGDLAPGAADLILDPRQQRFYSRGSAKRHRRFVLPLNNPSVEVASEAHFMRDDDVVLGVLIQGRIARAYPWWVAKHYHVINDSIPISDHRFEYITVLLCEVCSGATVFQSRIPGSPYAFGTFYICGLKFKEWGTFEVCDVETHSKWHPFRGEALAGPLKGLNLSRLPVFVGTWKEWRQRHQESTVVLAGSDLRTRKHTDDELAPGQESAFGKLRNRTLNSNDLVYSLVDRNIVYTLDLVKLNNGMLHDSDRRILVVQNGEINAIAFATTVEGEALSDFRRIPSTSGELLFSDSSKSVWDQYGIAVEGPRAGQSLDLLSGYVSEWYEVERYNENATVFSEKLEWHPLTQIPPEGLKSERPILVDFWAEWCAPCHEFENEVFSDPKVMAMLGRFDLYRADVTEASVASELLKKELGVTGLPSLRLLTPNGEILSEHSIYGFIDAKEFLDRLNTALGELENEKSLGQ